MIKVKVRIDTGQSRQAMKAKVLTVQKKLAFDVLEGVVIMTPVDTGRAKGNWFVSLVAPRLDYDWNAKDTSGGEIIANGTQTIGQLQDYGAIYLRNNLPYIIPLEKGHSRQAPAGMVQVSLDRATAGLR